jgi:hypothetical protein
VPSRVQVVEGVEDDGKVLEPVGRELVILDVGMVRNNLNVGVELLGGVLGNLRGG